MKKNVTVAEVLNFMETHLDLFRNSKIKVYSAVGKKVSSFCFSDIVIKTEIDEEQAKIYLKKTA